MKRGAMKWRALLGATFGALLLAGCVQSAVLENDVRAAEARDAALGGASDLELADAALASELVELEALYRRAPKDARVLSLLSRGYAMYGLGFVEPRRLEALAAGDAARADYEAARRRGALERAAFFAEASASPALRPWRELAALGATDPGARASSGRIG